MIFQKASSVILNIVDIYFYDPLQWQKSYRASPFLQYCEAKKRQMTLVVKNSMYIRVQKIRGIYHTEQTTALEKEYKKIEALRTTQNARITLVGNLLWINYPLVQ